MSETTTINLTKGERIDLTKTNPGLKIANAGLGWDVAATGANSIDLDGFALLLSGGKFTSNDKLIYFHQLTGHGVTHSGDSLTGEGDGDDETISFDLATIPAEVDEIIVCVNIYQGAEKNQNFGMVNNAFVRMYDKETTSEMGKFDLTEDYSKFTGIKMGKLYRKDAEWKFQAIGEGFSGSITDFVATYK